METREEHYASMMQAITRYAPSADLEVIQRAYEYADEKHKNQLRKSGEPYIIHPLAVADIVADLGLDVDSVIAALLHDCIEDTGATHEEIAKLFGRIPMFGICLGHQLMALAQGGSTVKLKYGHRGVNQPARDVCGTRTFLTSQNHGYAVVPESVKTGVIRYINANDGTCEGVDYPDLRAFSVQFHPEACSGPHDTAFLFDRFCDLMGGAHHAD